MQCVSNKSIIQNWKILSFHFGSIYLFLVFFLSCFTSRKEMERFKHIFFFSKEHYIHNTAILQYNTIDSK